MNNKLISIIIPVYNIEKYLGECLDSILNQTYQNFEIILVDDCSTDSSFNICNEYAYKDKRIKVIQNDVNSGGCGIPRNIGLKHIKGDYVTFIDGDDLIPANYLQVLISNSNGKDIAYVKYFFNWEKPIAKKKSRIIPRSKYLKYYFKDKYLIPAWGKLIPKNYFNNVEFVPGYYEDLPTMYKVVFKADRLVKCYETYYIYRKRENSLTTSDNSEKYLSVIDNLDFIHYDLPSYIESKKELVYFEYYKCRFYLIFYKFSVNSEDQKVLEYRKKTASFLRKNTLKFLFKRMGPQLKCALLMFFISPNLYLKTNYLRLWTKYYIFRKKEIILIKRKK